MESVVVTLQGVFGSGAVGTLLPRGWSSINSTQTPNWGSITTAQNPNWGLVDGHI